MKYQVRDYCAGICEKAAKGTIYQIIKVIRKRNNNSDSNFLLTDDAGDIPKRKAQVNSFVGHFSNAHGFESIPYDKTGFRIS